MANTLEIPGYSIVIPNTTFDRDTAPVSNNRMKDMPARQFLQMARYEAPSPDRIIQVVQEVAKTIGAPESEKVTSPAGIPLYEFMNEMPDYFAKEIRDGDPDAITHLRHHLPEDGFTVGKTYLQVTNGAIPTTVLRISEQELQDGGPEAYEELLGKAQYRLWHAKFQLSDGLVFPDAKTLEFLVANGVRDCNVFDFTGDPSDYASFAEHTRILGQVFSSPKTVANLPDYTDQFLKSRAGITLQTAVACTKTLEAIRQMKRIYGETGMPDMQTLHDGSEGAIPLEISQMPGGAVAMDLGALLAGLSGRRKGQGMPELPGFPGIGGKGQDPKLPN